MPGSIEIKTAQVKTEKYTLKYEVLSAEIPVSQCGLRPRPEKKQADNRNE
jgi:hypothetical protein